MSDRFSPALSSIKLRPEQQEFVDRFVTVEKRKTLLVAGVGTGKTVSSLFAAQKMLDMGKVDSTVIISDMLALRDQWRYSAKELEMDLSDSISSLNNNIGASITLQSVQGEKLDQLSESELSNKRLLLIIDETHNKSKAYIKVVDRILGLNEANRALYISQQIPSDLQFDHEFRFNSEFILEHSIIELPSTELQLSKYAPTFQILRELERGRVDIDDLSWREFEVLVANLLEKEGYEVELMQGSKDGGVDVIAYKDMGYAGQFKTLWQAKKKIVTNKVGISVVRELADTRQEFGASKAFVVTSSYLTAGALTRIARDNYTLGKIDRDDLNDWIDKVLHDDR